MEKLSIVELINKIEQLDLYLEKSGWERDNYIELNHKYKNYNISLTVNAPCSFHEEEDND